MDANPEQVLQVLQTTLNSLLRKTSSVAVKCCVVLQNDRQVLHIWLAVIGKDGM